MRPFLSVYGHVTIDQIITVENFPEIGKTEDVTSSTTVLGGTGTNIAMTAARLGCPTAICAFVGDDFPQAYQDEMGRSGLIMDEFVRVHGCDSYMALVFKDSSLLQKVLFYQGPQGFPDRFGIRLDKNASESRHVHFCTGQPSYYLSLMEGLHGASIALDPAQESHRIWNGENLPLALGFAGTLFCNEIEGKSLAGYMGKEDVLDLPTGMVVCTMSERGSVARIGDEVFRIPAVKPARFVDATGAGDSYRAGYYAALYRGYSAPEALTIAASVSSFVVEKTGALSNTPAWDDALERAEPYLKEIS